MNLPHHRDTGSRFDIPLSKIGSDLVQEFHQHWLRLGSDDRLPSRADIDPTNFKRILPNVILAGLCAAISDRCQPVFSYAWMEGASGGRNYFQTGIWPLASDGANPDMCIAVEDYLDLQRADLKAAVDKIAR